MLVAVLSLVLSGPPSGPQSPAQMLWQIQGCIACHGPTGKGDTKLGKERFVTDMTTGKWHNRISDDAMIVAIQKGIDRKVKGRHELMAAYELQPHQVSQLVELIRSWAPKRWKRKAAESQSVR